MEASAPAVATARYLILADSRSAIVAALARAVPNSVASSLLTGGLAWCRGDVRRAESSLRAALAAAASEERPYPVDVLAALLVACGRHARAAAMIAQPLGDPALEAARLALNAVVHAASGAVARSAADARAANAALGASDAAAGAAAHVVVAQRLATAAFYRGDAAAAFDVIDRGVAIARAASLSRGEAALHAVAYATARRLRGDGELAWHHARELHRAASAGGDVMLFAPARDALCELAAERDDAVTAETACAPHADARARPFGVRLAEALRSGADGRLDAARTTLAALEREPVRAPAERALCRALLATLAVAAGDDALARRLSRRVVSTSARPDKRVVAGEARRLRIARALAAVAAELAGDVVRARRAADTRLLRADRDVAALWERRDAPSVDRYPPAVRGYARFVMLAREAVSRRPPRAALTPAEAEILRAIAAGRTVAHIARDTARSPHTVRTHLRNASAKLDAHGRADLVAKARALGAI